MKHTTRALPLVMLLAVAQAQIQTVVNNPEDTSATTVYYSTCLTEETATTTLPETITCTQSPCTGGYPAITGAPGQGGYGPPPGYSGALGAGYSVGGEQTVTLPDGEAVVFETVFPQNCSTGMYYPTFTITEPCPCTESRASGYLPSGFSTTVATYLTSSCNTCPASETTMTLTTPLAAGPYASQTTNTVTRPAATGAGAAAGANGAGSSYPAATGTGASSPGASGAPGSGTAPGGNSPAAGAAAAGYSPVAASSVAGAAPGVNSPAAGNNGSGVGAPGSGAANADIKSNNSTISPPITPTKGGSTGSSGASAPINTFTGAAGKVDAMGISGFSVLAVFVGCAAFVL